MDCTVVAKPLRQRVYRLYKFCKRINFHVARRYREQHEFLGAEALETLQLEPNCKNKSVMQLLDQMD